jgi:hypothetical protein
MKVSPLKLGKLKVKLINHLRPLINYFERINLQLLHKTIDDSMIEFPFGI